MKPSIKQFNKVSENTFNRNHRKETRFKKQWSLIRLEDGYEFGTVRVYKTGKTVYVAIWFNAIGATATASNQSTYQSEAVAKAFEEAMKKMGFEFENPHYVPIRPEQGLEMVRDFFELGRCTIVKAHG